MKRVVSEELWYCSVYGEEFRLPMEVSEGWLNERFGATEYHPNGVHVWCRARFDKAGELAKLLSLTGFAPYRFEFRGRFAGSAVRIWSACEL